MMMDVWTKKCTPQKIIFFLIFVGIVGDLMNLKQWIHKPENFY